MAEGRGRLSSIDQLPDEAADDIVWACEQLAERRRTQADILFELNDRLGAKGLPPISRSAFSRKSIRVSAMQRRMAEAREMFSGLSGQLHAKDVDDNTIALGEFIKTLIMELVDDQAGKKSPRDAMELARAFHATIAGQKISADRRKMLEAAARDKAIAAVDAVADAAGAGIEKAEIIRKIREDIYGIFDAK